MILALENPCKSLFAKLCETLRNMRNHKLRNLANPCETLRNHICEFARKLAKACEIIFAKACETLVLLRKHICESLRKHMHFALAIRSCKSLRKHDLRNLAKGVFIACPTSAPGPPQNLTPQPGHPQQMLHYPGMPTNAWRNTVAQLFQKHKIVCKLHDLSCSHIFFRFKSLSRQSRNDRISASLIQLSVNVFSVWQGADGRGHHWPLKETWQTALQGGCPALASEIEAASFAILQQISNSTAWSVKLTWQPVFLASIQFFVVLDTYNQSSCESSVILMVHSSLLVFRYFHLFRQNTLTWSRVRLVTSSKHTEVKVLFTMFSGLESLDPTLAVHLNFCNFRNFRI